MGATKRLAELVATYQRQPPFRPVVVRFGNILGSSGSVVEIMAEAVRAGPQHPGDRSRRHPLLHDRGRSRVAGDQGRSDGPRRRGLLARHGHAAAHRRSGRSASSTWAHAGRADAVGIDVIGLRAGREAARGADDAGAGDEEDEPPAHLVGAAEGRVAARRSSRPSVRFRRACASGDATMALDTLAAAVGGYEPSEVAVKAARSASRRVGAPSSKVTTAVA